MDSEPALDRRQRKSRRALHAALLELVATRPYATITVDEIAATADLARATFYAHYRDKNALLIGTYQELMGELMPEVADVTWRTAPTYSGIGLTAVLRHVDQHRALYRVLLGGQGGPVARAAVISSFTGALASIVTERTAERQLAPRLPIEFITTSVVGALLLTIEQWLNGNLEGDVDSLVGSFVRGQTGGLAWALGFQPGEVEYVPVGD